MNGFSGVDLSDLPAPQIVEALDYEAILAELLSEMRSRDEAYSALVESDPAYKILEIAAYREVLLRQRVNDAARAVMLAYATGDDLENLAALVPVLRKTIDPGDPHAYPPINPTYESDTAFRRRVQLAPEGFSTAGPDGAYVFHTLAVEGVRDVSVLSPAPVDVEVYVLGLSGEGVPSESVLNAVRNRLADGEIRPLTDRVTVLPAEIVTYQVEAAIHMPAGPSPDSVQKAAEAALQAYVASRHVMGAGVALSGIYEALHVAGVVRVELASPHTDILLTQKQAAYCTGIQISMVSE